MSCAHKNQKRELSSLESDISLLNCHKKDSLANASGISQVSCESDEVAIAGGCSIPDSFNKDRKFLKIEVSTPIMYKNLEPDNVKGLQDDLRKQWKRENNFNDGHISGWECKFGLTQQIQLIGVVPSLKGLESHVVCCK